MRLLIVDDEALIAQGLRSIVLNMDTVFRQADIAFSGSEALRKLREQPCDLMIVDVSMPGMTGLELIRQAREEGLCENFCVLSGYSKFEYAQDAVNLGVTQYLLKPVDKDKLRSYLDACARRILQRQAQQRHQRENALSNALFNGAEVGELPLGECLVVVVEGANGDDLDMPSEDVDLHLRARSIHVFVSRPDRRDSLSRQLLQCCPKQSLGVAQGAVQTGAQLRRLYLQAARAALLARHLLDRPILEAAACASLPPPFSNRFDAELKRSFGLTASEKQRALLEIRLRSLPGHLDTDLQPGSSMNPYVRQMCQLLHQRFREKLTLGDVADQIGVSSDYAGRLFKESQGISFHEALNRYRVLQAAQSLMQHPDLSLEQLALCMGFADARSFYRAFSKVMKMTPGEYKRAVLEAGAP